MPTIPLTPHGWFAKSEPWNLQLSSEGAELFDSSGGKVGVLQAADVPTHIEVPGKLMSGEPIIINAGGKAHKFKYDPAAVDAIRQHQDALLAANPEAIRNLKRLGLRTFALGLVLGVACWGFILAIISHEPYQREIPPTLGKLFYAAWCPALASPFLALVGLKRWWRAAALARRQPQEPTSE